MLSCDGGPTTPAANENWRPFRHPRPPGPENPGALRRRGPHSPRRRYRLPWLILQLEGIAPVTAVLGQHRRRTLLQGNRDRPTRWPQISRPSYRGCPRARSAAPPPHHSRKSRRGHFRPHAQAVAEMVGSTLYFNPGYAGRPRLAWSEALPSWIATARACGRNSSRSDSEKARRARSACLLAVVAWGLRARGRMSAATPRETRVTWPAHSKVRVGNPAEG